MNAYSDIRKQGKRTLSERFRTRAYRRGFHDGFAAPVLFYQPVRFRRAEAIEVSIEAAWSAVSGALKVASEKEVKRIGKAAREVAAND